MDQGPIIFPDPGGAGHVVAFQFLSAYNLLNPFGYLGTWVLTDTFGYF